ncbi:MAG TPA: ADP-ribosylglycohydrolase family protein [Aggregatilineales bacterium]|nr:ADP-ribosylglycohydrolase family protein [Aggregatilineales bacterium]
MTSQPQERLERARCALEGLSVGDSFGERWFYIPPELAPGLMAVQAEPAPIWDYTDDTQMALSIYSILRQHGTINRDQLALSFVRRYNPHRKYGASMRGLFQEIREGVPWREAAGHLFDGQGSFGNGAAMRVAPVGGYFADDLEMVVEQARRSAEVTHAHSEGIAGAIAVAIGAAVAWQLRGAKSKPNRQKFIGCLLAHIPDSEVRSKTVRARDIPLSWSSFDGVVALLGNGIHISAQDTVPFCLWCAGEFLDNYEQALWLTAKAGGDIDTNCAIVGGIVAMFTGIEGIPEAWRNNREPLPSWAVDTT